ncbi:MAG: DUF481 domain-containing protein [Gammaproteobacteria bacterium]|nr:DUF481 domain-containing protein [Gammaproteobacteria bacterium]
MRHSSTLACIFCLFSPFVYADKEAPGWHGEGEFGLAITSGNSDTETLNGRLGLVNNIGLWRHTLRLEALSVSDNETTTAERYTFGYKADRKISEYNYLFGALRYDDDRFSGFDFQSSLTTGYGRRLFERQRSRLDAELGAGFRFAETVTGETQDGVIARLYGDYEYKVSDNAWFNQTLLIEPSLDNTFTESVTAFKVGFAEKLALRLSLTAKNNSDAPAGSTSTDTITAVSVVYSF